MNKTQTKQVQATRPQEPLAYEEAIRRYADWCERESANEGVIPIGVPQPNRRISGVVGSTWYLENVHGPLAKVGANGRVFRPQKEPVVTCPVVG